MAQLGRVVLVRRNLVLLNLNESKIIIFSAGGSGGINGVFTFIPTHYGNKFVNFENHPKSLATTGLSGTAGKTAKLCKTDAIEFDIYTDTDTMWLFGNCNFNRLTRNINRVDNPRCPNDYLSEEAVPAPKPRDFLDTLKSAFLA